MKKLSFYSVFTLLSVVILSLSSCEIVGDIFKAGVWVGVLVVVGIIALVLFLLRKIF
jgi:hypothetical protein